MLNPNSRSLYTSALTPPPGMVFDEAVATSFSMDPGLLLEAPVYLALMVADDQTAPDPLSVLEAIRRYSERITVYVQKGRIQVPQITRPNPLFGFLESMTVEVTAQSGGVFHPKLWAIRFVSPDRQNLMYRLVILTRNMTADKSWDLSLQLEGTMGRRKQEHNQALAHFFQSLPGLTSGEMPMERMEQANRFSNEILRVQWELPEGFDELAFYLPGTEGFDWSPPPANRMAVLSPFCSDEALQALIRKTGAADALISRPESLSALNKDTIGLFSQCLHLDEAAETEDGEENDTTLNPLSTGLHAKAYLFEKGWNTEIVMGSANATNAALMSKINCEILVSLSGRRSKVGGIDELLGDDGMGDYLVTFAADPQAKIDTQRQQAEKWIEKARTILAEAELSIACQNALKEGLWALTLTGQIPILDGIDSVKAWPISVTDDYAVNITQGVTDGIKLGEFSASSLTGLIAFELKTSHPDVFTRFVLNLPLSGIPDERDSAILQTVIGNQDGFIRYLLLLLGEETAGSLGTDASAGMGLWISRLAAGKDIALLEEMVRVFSRQPERLTEISKLVDELSQGNRDAIIPEDFLHLWSVFDMARRRR